MGEDKVRRLLTPPVARPAVVAAVLGLWLYGAASACQAHVPAYALDDGGDGGDAGTADVAPPDASVPDSGEEEEGESEVAPPPTPPTRIRFAVWSPDLPEADFCVAPLAAPPDAGDSAPPNDAGSDEDEDAGPVWQGPLVAQAASEVDGGIGVFADAETPGVAFPQVTSYLSVPAGAYRVRTVAAGSSDCAAPMLADATLPTLNANARTTLARVGDYMQAARDPVSSLVVFTDDFVGVSGRVELRFVAALPSVGSLSLGVGKSGSRGSESLFTGVPFGERGAATESDAGKVDPNGYLTTPPLEDATLTATIAKGADAGGAVIVADGVTIPSGSVATLAAVGGKTFDTLEPPRFLLCLDTASAVDVLFAECHLIARPTD
jgi:hypothetical protein